jgi:serine/threonine protein kinase
MAMEYVAGERLTETIRRVGSDGKLDWRRAYRFAVHIARALAYAHGQGTLHRNVTPQNVLVDAPTKTAKLGDLMLAKALEGSVGQPQLTRPGELLGAVNYLAPERTRPDVEVDGRADLYGLGATAYALLTGRPPFDGATLVERITRIRQTEPEPPTRYQQAIPARFEALVLKLLAKRPEDRPQTADAVLAELDRFGKSNGATA